MREKREKTKTESALCPASIPFASLLCLVLISGCRRAPTFSILGSFFPAWLICMVVGIVLAFAANRLLVYLKIDKEILWSILVYPCLAMFFACTLWLIFFS
jgi:hypothetical protein